MHTSLLKRGFVSLCLFPVLFSQSIWAQDSTELDDVVVTASRQAQPIENTVGDVTVIGQDDIAKSGGQSLAKIISRAPGVQFTDQGGPQTNASLFIRGTDSNHTLVLINGMRVNGATTGTSLLQAIDPNAVERIEILRGSASSLYGSDAIGGVVNIITKTGKQDQPLSVWGNIGAGSHHSADGTLGFSGAQGVWDYSLSTTEEKSDGFNATTKDNAFSYYPDKDGYHSRSITGRVGLNWADGHRVEASAYNGYIRGEYDAGSAAPDAHDFNRQQVYQISSTDQLTEFWQSQLSVGYTEDSNEAYDSAPRAYRSYKWLYSWQNRFDLTAHQHITLITEHANERVSKQSDFTRRTRHTNSAGLIYQADFNRLHLQASGRNDHYTDYGNQATGSLGLDYDIAQYWQVGVAGNTGFHAPTFNDMYDQGPFATPNPDLAPEKSRNAEAHIQFQTDKTLLKLTTFRNKIKDLIEWDSGTQKSFNVGHAKIQGLTLEGRQQFANTTLYGSADWLSARNEEDHSRLFNRAQHVYHAGVEQRIKQFNLGAEYQYTGKRYAYGDVPMEHFSLVNLTAGYDFTKDFKLQVRWDNIFNKDYTLVDGYQTPGSTVYAKFSWRM